MTRATDRLALVLAALVAPSTALAQETAAQPSAPPAAPAPIASAAPVAARVRLPLGAPADPMAYPAAQSPSVRDASAPGVELHGYVAAWWTPHADPSPVAARDVFRLRFAVLRVDAQIARGLTALVRLGLMVPDSPLLDAHVTWTPHDAFAVSAGQFRLPLGAAATTLAPQLVMLDRPGYVSAMTKATFRDVGVMLHTSPHGLADGVVHAWLAVTSGAGRVGVGPSRAPEPLAQYLYAGRVLVDVGRALLRGPRDRLALGLSFAHAHDPALAMTDRAAAAQTLGRTLAPYTRERDTLLAGADLTFSYAGVWVQAETLYLRATPVNGDPSREAHGASVEAAYTLPTRPFDLADVQVALRGERFDPDLNAPNDEQLVGTFGLNVIPTPAWRASVFATATHFTPAGATEATTASELTLRLAAGF